MDIGQKLKSARIAASLTQESVAEKIGVSRQTISNWENNKSYPDIVSVIALSDLYSISLDELLKEDKNMIEHLEESTNVVNSRKKLSKLIQIMSFLVIWSASIIMFWLGGRSDAMGYSLVTFYLVLPISIMVISFFIGKEEGWANYKWIMLLFFGLMYMLASYATFSLANMLAFEKINRPDVTGLLPGIVCAAIGMSLGMIIKIIGKKHKSSNYDIENNKN